MVRWCYGCGQRSLFHTWVVAASLKLADVNSSIPPTLPVGDSEPGPPPSLPGVALWSDSDAPAAEGGQLAGLLPKPASPVLPTIGHIGRYALKYQLGEGGLGTVFAAHDPLLSRLIAVKTLNVELPEDKREAFNTLFINEARAAGGLSHPHIVTVFDAGISDKRAYIAMELLKGRDLRQLRQEGWRATPAQAALIVRRVADALAFAHSKGVIHRDIKPANIFMVGRTQPRVLDFGIARVAHQQSDDTNAGAGSPYYMAPEQILRQPADRRADVFSLGVVLYELLADEKPFRGDSLKDIRHAVLMLEPPLANKVDSSVPRALAEIAARAMAKDPEHRFRSARSFARELRQWLDANPALVEGAVVALPGAPGRPRARTLAWTAAALLTLAVGSVVGWQTTLPTVPIRGVDAAVATKLPAPIVAPLRPVAAKAEVDVFDPGASATAARTAALSTPEAIMSSSLGLINAPGAASRPASVAVAAPAAVATATAPAAVAAVAPLVSPVVSPALPPVAATAPPRESVKERRTRELRDRETRDRDQRLAAATQLVAPATGTVRIAISPWGQVEVDGNASGAAPPLTELTLSVGRHQIVVRNGDFAPYATSVNVVAGQAVSLHYKFGP